jgi:hypothetical protein
MSSNELDYLLTMLLTLYEYMQDLSDMLYVALILHKHCTWTVLGRSACSECVKLPYTDVYS